ncbi:hypothetical protein D7X88_03105 [bacterium C-53]|nr:hypothetical protein [Lachnospiraceae bacterium]NBI02006.1 hypothetical protein [Lachnospiraceae bacterium]RKJ12396.1 hypothetical protein D7X88_03105 [bacterium C-53]
MVIDMGEVRVHRVGTITFGLTLIGFGILFFIRMIFKDLGYELVYKMWPLLFISLGTEVLLADRKYRNVEVVYDKPAILLTALLTLFAVCMAFVGQMIEWGIAHPYY